MSKACVFFMILCASPSFASAPAGWHFQSINASYGLYTPTLSNGYTAGLSYLNSSSACLHRSFWGAGIEYRKDFNRNELSGIFYHRGFFYPARIGRQLFLNNFFSAELGTAQLKLPDHSQSYIRFRPAIGSFLSFQQSSSAWIPQLCLSLGYNFYNTPLLKNGLELQLKIGLGIKCRGRKNEKADSE
jgi:hypothetical protein